MEPNKKTYRSNIFKEFRTLSHEMSFYYSLKMKPPKEIEQRFHICLNTLRDKLDSMGFQMPKAIYPYISNDNKTHRFIRADKGKSAKLNPDYIYRDQWQLRSA